ncbi:uncharacterized protein LOC110892956 [Helianthus annuus]|uniref:uncharacterized protein LOC110892956 n=1 Tax=Helianthus annuus TaxID=4232 RepID=UPI000B8F9480|nr:uncharacterized protein LOC110892956 [Helianthus annuus]
MAQIIIEEEETSSERRTRQQCLNRDREVAHDSLMADYFAENPVYTKEMFRRKRGFTTLQKCTSAIRQLAYGTSSDVWDEMKMSDRTSRDSLYQFCKGVVKLYSTKYLRRPTNNDIIKLYHAHKSKHDFPGMLGSTDCMRNYPNAWRGQFTRCDHGHPTLILEVVASNDLWSDVFNDIINGTGPDSRFSVSGVEYKHECNLADGIYPTYAVIVKTIPYPEDEKRKKFAKCQESARC